MKGRVIIQILALQVLFATISGCGGQGGSSNGGGSTPPTLQSMDLTFSASQLQPGQTSQATVTGHYSDGSSQNLTSSATYSLNPAGFGNISGAGLYHAPNQGGTVAITASVSGVNSKLFTITVSSPVTLESITLSFSSTNLTFGQTSQATATGNYSDGSHQDLTSSGIYNITPSGFGTISGSGLYTAPNQSGSAQITLTTQGITSNSVTITVTEPPIVLNSVVPAFYGFDGVGDVQQTQLTCTGCAVGDQLTIAPVFGTGPLTTVTNPIPITLPFDSGHWNPGWLNWSVSDGTETSNTLGMAFVGNQNTMTNTSTEIFNLETGRQIVHKFKMDGSSDGNCSLTDTLQIAADNQTGDLLTVYNSGSDAVLGIYDEECNQIFGYGSPDGSPGNGVAVAGDHGGASVIRGSAAQIDYVADITNPAAPLNFASTDSDPHNLVMQNVSGQERGYVWSRGASKLDVFALGATQVTSLGSTPALSGLSTGVNNEFQLIIVGTHAAVLDETKGILVFIDLGTLTESKRVTLQGSSFRITADAAANAVIVASADTNAIVTRFSSVAVATGTVTQLTGTSTLLSTGLGLTPDGTHIIACMREQCVLISKQ